jgi:hypothetical protein
MPLAVAADFLLRAAPKSNSQFETLNFQAVFKIYLSKTHNLGLEGHSHCNNMAWVFGGKIEKYCEKIFIRISPTTWSHNALVSKLFPRGFFYSSCGQPWNFR